jgi:hypothetical protein
MLAHALLCVLTATTRPPDPGSGVIPLTRNEIRRHLAAATAPSERRDVAHPALVHLDDDIKPAPEQATCRTYRSDICHLDLVIGGTARRRLCRGAFVS